MASIFVDDYPQLLSLCWNRKVHSIDESEALQLYESGWRFIEKDKLTPSELSFIGRLTEIYGNGVLHV
jgi:hypothetical protein